MDTPAFSFSCGLPIGPKEGSEQVSSGTMSYMDVDPSPLVNQVENVKPNP